MTSKLDRINKVADEYVESGDIDLNEGHVSAARLLPEGKALGRLIEYIEYGPQLNKKFPEKLPTNQFRLAFAIWGKAKNGETYHSVGEKGVLVPGIVRSRSYAITDELNTKSNAYKVFRRMNPEKTAKHFAQLLNTTFIIPIVHTQAKDNQGKEVTYANIDMDNIMQAVDPVTDTPYNVPEVADDSMFKIFLWNRPDIEDWDALFIEGKNDDGKSKNFIQETILSSPKYPGSPLDILLSGGQGTTTELPDLDTSAAEKEATPPAELPVAEKPKAVKEKAPRKPKAKKEDPAPAPDKEPDLTSGDNTFGLPNL